MKKKKQKNFSYFIPYLFVDAVVFGSAYFNAAMGFFQIIFFNFLVTLVIAMFMFNKKETKSLVLLILIAFLNLFLAFVLLFLSMSVPGSKQHTYIMYNLCLPAIKRYYGYDPKQPFPTNGPLDEKGWGRWWYQHVECEENVRKGKGPIFSENPPRFVPLEN